MKKVIAILGVMGILTGMAGMAQAVVDDYWLVQARAENISSGSQGAATFGTKSTYGDGIGTLTEDTEFPTPVAGVGEIVCTDLGAGGRWQKDQRASLTLANTITNPMLWHLSAYLNGVAAGNVEVKFWVPSAAKIDGTDTIVALYSGTLTAEQIKAATPIFTFTPGMSGSSTDAGANYRALVDYTNGSAKYTLAAYAAVPEPGSMLALFSGIVGLAGFGIRRRK